MRSRSRAWLEIEALEVYLLALSELPCKRCIMLARLVKELCTDILVQVTARAFESFHMDSLHHAVSCDRRTVVVERVDIKEVVTEPLACWRFLHTGR